MIIALNQKLRRNMKIKDEQGQKMDAMVLFSESIRFLTNHLYESIKKSRPDFEREDVFWVITVPGVWKYNAKIFMKEAALKVLYDQKYECKCKVIGSVGCMCVYSKIRFMNV